MFEIKDSKGLSVFIEAESEQKALEHLRTFVSNVTAPTVFVTKSAKNRLEVVPQTEG